MIGDAESGFGVYRAANAIGDRMILT